MFKRQPTETQLIFFTLVLVLLMGVPTFDALMGADDEGTEISLTVASKDNLREPASIASGVVQTSKVLSVAKHDLDCKKKSPPEVVVDGEFLQIQGQICSGDLGKKKIEIVNESNGYTAEVFESGLAKYQTDLIQLQQGSNKILIRYTNSTGKSVEDVLEVKTSDKSML